MVALAPFAIIAGILGTIAFVTVSYWDQISDRVALFGNRFRHDLEVAGMRSEPQKYLFLVAGIGSGTWALTILLFHHSLVFGLVAFAIDTALTVYGAGWYVRTRRRRRIAKFQDQLEQALRTLAGGVRVGLGIRQAFVMTAEQSRSPLKTEFTRVVGLSNVGVSLLDAFDRMASRMTNPETAMLARVLRVQSQSGGDLGSVLMSLADTIRDRRRLMRKVSAITAQGRATGWLLGLLPIALGAFVAVVEPTMRDAMVFTTIGRVFLGTSLAMDGLSIFFIMKIVHIDP